MISEMKCYCCHTLNHWKGFLVLNYIVDVSTALLSGFLSASFSKAGRCYYCTSIKYTWKAERSYFTSLLSLSQYFGRSTYRPSPGVGRLILSSFLMSFLMLRKGRRWIFFSNLSTFDIFSRSSLVGTSTGFSIPKV